VLLVDDGRDPAHAFLPEQFGRPLPGFQPLLENGKVELAGLELHGHGAGGTAHHLDFDVGCTVRECAENPGEGPDRKLGVDANPDAAGRRGPAQVIQDAIVHGEDVTRPDEQGLTLRTEFDAAALAPVNQLLFEDSFKPLHLQGHG